MRITTWALKALQATHTSARTYTHTRAKSGPSNQSGETEKKQRKERLYARLSDVRQPRSSLPSRDVIYVE